MLFPRFIFPCHSQVLIHYPSTFPELVIRWFLFSLQCKGGGGECVWGCVCVPLRGRLLWVGILLLLHVLQSCPRCSVHRHCCVVLVRDCRSAPLAGGASVCRLAGTAAGDVCVPMARSWRTLAGQHTLHRAGLQPCPPLWALQPPSEPPHHAQVAQRRPGPVRPRGGAPPVPESRRPAVGGRGWESASFFVSSQ